MQSYKVELIKKISLKGGSLTPSDNKYNYSVIGNFQRMRVEEVCNDFDFRKMEDYPKSVEKDGVRYYVHALFFFDAANNGGEPFPSNDKKYYMITVINLEKSNSLFSINPLDDTHKLNSEQMVKMISSAIVKKIDTSTRKTKLYAGLGASDIVMVTGADEMSELPGVWPILNNMTVSDLKDAPYADLIYINKKDTNCLFESASSYFAIHDSLNLKDKIDKLTAYVFIKMGDMNTNGVDIKEIFSKYSEANHVSIVNMQGELDISLYLENASLYKTMCLLNMYNSNDETLVAAAAQVKEFFDKNAETFTIRLVDKHLTFNIKEKPNDKIDHTKSINHLETLAHNIIKDGKVPVPAKRTLDFLVDKCICMLRTNRRYISSLRMFRLIRRVLLLIERNNNADKNFSGLTITRCLDKLSSTINTIILANNLNLDQHSGNDVETINPAIKLFYAHESMIGKLYHALLDNELKESMEMDPLFFLTVTPDDRISSCSYLIDNTKKGHRLISINLPDVSYFFKRRAMAYIAHEFAHYIPMTKELNILKTAALNDLMLSYVYSYIWTYLTERATNIPPDKFAEFFTYFVNEKVKFEFDKDASIFYNTLYFMNFLNDLFEMLNKHKYIFVENNDSVAILVYNYICSAVMELCRSSDIFEAIGASLREARADIYMCEICNLDFDDYLKCHFDYMDNNKITSAMNDYFYLMRLSMVLSVLCEHNGRIKIKEHIKTLKHQKQAVFANKVLDFWNDAEGTFNVAVEFLQKVRNVAKEKLNALKSENKHVLDIYDVKEGMGIEKTSLIHLYNEWYDSMRYWRTHKDDD